ncbi:hypothetical protein L1987_23283 [Smallanthus sonchifolius]|uniref:Uncharacterized protein n=1 Tax=Smallanthus sonchifolius TaxID=185202 RepID=A0ACB9IIN9_9ASTR|nr:hypothetical protein L1987_23283 [Smallanthus sonchifolius]
MNSTSYPYTWYVYTNLHNRYDVYGGYHPYVHREPYDEVLILDSFDHETEHYNGGRYHPYDEVLILDGFDHETEHCNNGGLTKKVIDENLKVSNYRGNGEEVL